MKAKIMTKEGHKEVNLNRRQAIRERCLNCKAWYPSEVTNCPFNHCPLHPFRTSNGKQNPAQREKAIKQYCLSCMNGQVGEVRRCTVPDCPLFFCRRGGTEVGKKIPSLKRLNNGEAFSLIASRVNEGLIQSLKRRLTCCG